MLKTQREGLKIKGRGLFLGKHSEHPRGAVSIWLEGCLLGRAKVALVSQQPESHRATGAWGGKGRQTLAQSKGPEAQPPSPVSGGCG